MSKVPPIPKDQQSRGAAGAPSRDAEVARDPSRDRSQVNLKEQGASANLRQNLTHARNQQGR